ncbi:GNAT family N-acetyltransferase [Asanoa iriomotensis]|uniref:N-acetyltransferase domain-containing protein n=1 Tax=Asanoa iriomotensis TaxID=234613 RepID=A0ABQ4C170_9ACTN|nr:GNAT family N-acetyltransferase [Asanoa iriomotensis]GIF56524.1 hypothetical protein Air01nite_26190 [Asanoa iriomotensis]
MTDDPLLTRARRLWCLLAGSPVVFGGTGIDMAVAPRSALCPPGWVGVVALGEVAIATVPDTPTMRTLACLPRESWLSAGAVLAGLPVVEEVGPARLSYLAPESFRPAAAGCDAVAADDPGVKALLASVPATDESGLAEITSPAFVVREEARVVAAAGYRRWPGGTAHLSVLTDPAERGRGLGRCVASAAVSDALAEGLLPQWRAREEASCRVAAALGFRDLGWHLSLRLAEES